MGKKTQYTVITPLPSRIPRQLAIDMLHSHGEIIELNPLVLEHHPIKAPKDASPDEFFSVWHEITERIQYVPGMGRMGSGKISFKGVFHDMPWGLQTHIYAPAGVDIRNKWQIKGNQSGEPRQVRELGDKAPVDGLYLQEDIEINCNFTMISFVKKNLQKASAILVARLLKKAELLDAGQLQAMIENGRLKTVNPAVQNHFALQGAQSADPQLPSQMAAQAPYSPQLLPNDVMSPVSLSARNSVRNSYYPPSQHLSENGSMVSAGTTTQSAYARQAQYAAPHNFAVEMPGSYHYPQSQAQNPAYLQSQSQNTNNRTSYMSELSGSSPRRTSFPTPLLNNGNGSSPNLGGGVSPRVGLGGGSHTGSQYSDTVSEAHPQSVSQHGGGGGGYNYVNGSAQPMGSPGQQFERDRYSVASEMPTYER